MAKLSAPALQTLVDVIVALGHYRQRGSKTLPLSKTTLCLVKEDVKMYLLCSDHGACLSCYMENVVPFLEDPRALRAVCKDCLCDIATNAVSKACFEDGATQVA